jgi:hypothetical protein
VLGQKALQASNDPMLGYTELDGRHYYVRQMKNLKASIPVEWLTGGSHNFLAWACRALLARARRPLATALLEVRVTYGCTCTIARTA